MDKKIVFTLDEVSKIIVGEDKQGGLIDDYFDYRLQLDIYPKVDRNRKKINFKEWYLQNNNNG